MGVGRFKQSTSHVHMRVVKTLLRRITVPWLLGEPTQPWRCAVSLLMLLPAPVTTGGYRHTRSVGSSCSCSIPGIRQVDAEKPMRRSAWSKLARAGRCAHSQAAGAIAAADWSFCCIMVALMKP
jgi:hypothetical protein